MPLARPVRREPSGDHAVGTGPGQHLGLVADGLDRFWLYEQSFVCLPFEHSEEIADQDLSVMLYARMAVEAPDGWLANRRELVDYATKHRDIIRKFGRFPHRNVVLGRTSTPEELEFLKGGRGY